MYQRTQPNQGNSQVRGAYDGHPNAPVYHHQPAHSYHVPPGAASYHAAGRAAPQMPNSHISSASYPYMPPPPNNFGHQYPPAHPHLPVVHAGYAYPPHQAGPPLVLGPAGYYYAAPLPHAQAGAMHYYQPQQPPLPLVQASNAGQHYSPPQGYQQGMHQDAYSLPATPAASSDICQASSPRAALEAASVDEDQVPALPIEVIEMVIGWAVLDMESSKDGAVLCALMHVSRKVRVKVMQHFVNPLPLFQCAVTPQKAKSAHASIHDALTAHEVDWPPCVVAYMIQLLKWASMPAFSLLSKDARSPVPEPPSESWEVRTTSGEMCKAVHVDITCKPDPVVLRGKRLLRKDEPNFKSRSYARSRGFGVDPGPLSSSDIYTALRQAVVNLAPVTVRACHPYHLALHGTLSQLPTAGVVFSVKLRLGNAAHWDYWQSIRYEKFFQFDSLSTLRDKKGYPLPQTSATPTSAALSPSSITLPVSEPTGPAFPIELIQRVIDHAVVDFRASKDSSVLRALLHTSCKIRARVVEAFAPIRLQRREVARKDDDAYDSDGGFDSDCGFSEDYGSKIDFAPDFFTYIEKMLQWVLFRDFSTRRFAATPDPSYAREQEKLPVLGTDGEEFELALCKMLVKPDTFTLPSGKRSLKKDSPNQEKKGRSPGFSSTRSLNYGTLYHVLDDAIKHKSASFKAPGLNPYQRLLGEASLDAPVKAGVLIELTLDFGSVLTAWCSNSFHQTWIWDTVPARDAKGKPVVV